MIINNASLVPSLHNINKEYSYDSNKFPVHFTCYYYGKSVGLIKQYSPTKWKLLAGQCPLNCSLVYTDDDDVYGETLANYILRGEHIVDFGKPQELLTRQEERMVVEIEQEKPKPLSWKVHVVDAFKAGVSKAKYCRAHQISRVQLYHWKRALDGS